MSLVGAAAYSLYGTPSSVSNPTPVAAPPEAQAPAAPSIVEKQTRIIERTIEKLVMPTEVIGQRSISPCC